MYLGYSGDAFNPSSFFRTENDFKGEPMDPISVAIVAVLAARMISGFTETGKKDDRCLLSTQGI